MTRSESPKGRLLVVEDDRYVRESLGAMLGSRGYDATLAQGVAAAVEVLRKTPVDLILTDLNMPAGGGLEVVRRARALSAETPIVVLTGFGTIASAVECVKAGASDYVLKPADPDALDAALERAMTKPPAEDLTLRGSRATHGREERAVLVEALRRSKGVRKEAARLLGIDHRNLGYYLLKHGIDPDDPV